MKLPQWKQCEENVRMEVFTPLEWFIFMHEPHDLTKARQWRDQLCHAVNSLLITTGNDYTNVAIGQEYPEPNLVFKFDEEVE